MAFYRVSLGIFNVVEVIHSTVNWTPNWLGLHLLNTSVYLVGQSGERIGGNSA